MSTLRTTTQATPAGAVARVPAVHSRCLAALFILAAGMIPTVAVRAQTAPPAYSFVRVVEAASSSTFDTPSLNAAGTVAFGASLTGPGRGIFTGPNVDGSLTTVASVNGGMFSGFSVASLNAVGTVAFPATEVSGGAMGIYTVSSGGQLTTVADNRGAFNLFGNVAAINAPGTVVFRASLDNVTGQPRSRQGLYAYNPVDGTTVNVVNNLGEFDIFGNAPALNVAGTIAFSATRDTAAGGGTGLYLSSNGQLTAVADTNGTPFSGFNDPALNDAGTVAFQANLDAPGGSGIYRRDPVTGVITTVADGSGAFNNFTLAPAINAAGTVVFRAELDVGGFGIFTGPDAVADRVVATGDDLFGSAFSELFLSARGFNDAGQIAFRYVLADGRQGIAIASPVPEPGTWAMLMLGVGILLILVKTDLRQKSRWMATSGRR